MQWVTPQLKLPGRKRLEADKGSVFWQCDVPMISYPGKQGNSELSAACQIS